jgi:hypothetical protein
MEIKMPHLHISAYIRRLFLNAALSLAAFASPVSAVEPANADVLGTWKLTKVLDSAEITSMDDKEAARLVGKKLVIEPHKVLIAGETCHDPYFERHQEPAAKYVRENYHAPVGRLGLPDTVTVVDLHCTEALIKGANKVVVFWDGFFYDAEKQISKPGPQRKRATH